MTYPRGDDYQARFDRLAAQGTNVHGEVDFVLGLDPRPASVLDAGCGTGRVAIELARRGVDVVGTDVDPAMLATARRLAPELPWIEADLAELDVGRRFDAVVLAGNVLLFVAPGGQPAVLARCAAHLAPGGALVAGFSVPPVRPGGPGGTAGPGRPGGALGGGYDLERLDADAAAAGLDVAERWATWDRRPWTPSDDYAVTVLRAGGA
jgi:SAM-dependent methyltransferase